MKKWIIAKGTVEEPVVTVLTRSYWSKRRAEEVAYFLTMRYATKGRLYTVYRA